MEKREIFKNIEISGRSWRIQKFDALTGSFILFKVMGIITPLLKNLNFKDIKDVKSPDDVKLNYTDMLSGLVSLSEDDFKYIQTKCLRVCYEVLPAGNAQVLDENLHFGVEDIEHDTATVLALTVHALIFNVTGFFGESLLGFLPKGVTTLFQHDVKT